MLVETNLDLWFFMLPFKMLDLVILFAVKLLSQVNIFKLLVLVMGKTFFGEIWSKKRKSSV